MKQYFAYIRVSTPKQGQGVSLQEQRAAILAHATRHNLTITEWFEEKETAAKEGLLRAAQAGRLSPARTARLCRPGRWKAQNYRSRCRSAAALGLPALCYRERECGRSSGGTSAAGYSSATGHQDVPADPLRHFA